MPKFFVCSDIHSGYTPWMEALEKAGFNPDDDNHKIVLCGDLFDRMGESLKAYKFAKDMIERGKLIYVKGNHEQLLVDCCERGWAMSHDMSNGTMRTIVDLGVGDEFYDRCEYVLKKVKPIWEHMVNYFETKHYIFVHSWIPVFNKDGKPARYIIGRSFEFNPDWRNASQAEWDAAMWVNPFDMADCGLLPDKTVVFGHWHCSTGWAKSEGRSEFGDDAKFDPYYGNGYIGIDACIAYSGKCNVIVIEDELLEE